VLAALLAGFSQAGVAPAATAEPRPAPRELAVAAAERLVAGDPARVHRSPHDRIFRLGVLAGARGLHYVSYGRTYAGLPVRGGDFVVVTDSAGHVLSTSVAQTRELAVSTEPAIPPAMAAKRAHARLDEVTDRTDPRLTVVAEGAGRLVYETVESGVRNRRPSRFHIHVDAKTGEVTEKWDEVLDGIGNSHFHGRVEFETTRSATMFGMSDPVRPGLRCGGTDGRTYTDPDDTWGNGSGTDLVTACVDAMYEAQKLWDMLGAWLGRSGLDGHGRGYPMRVGYDIVNAFFNYYYAGFGHNAAGTKQMTATDVVAHELGHAIYNASPGSTAPSALHESAGDIFGALTEWYFGDSPDYLVGEDVDTVGDGPIRYMYNPSIIAYHASCYDDRIGEVHADAGVHNHWFYLLAEGSHANDPSHGRPNSPTCNGSVVSGVGIVRAGMVFMETLNRKTTEWSHIKARTASLEAARQLFPDECNVFTTVRAAWDAVGVPADPYEPPFCS
jgi:Zn-dependent metalloprotease